MSHFYAKETKDLKQNFQGSIKNRKKNFTSENFLIFPLNNSKDFDGNILFLLF